MLGCFILRKGHLDHITGNNKNWHMYQWQLKPFKMTVYWLYLIENTKIDKLFDVFIIYKL